MRSMSLFSSYAACWIALSVSGCGSPDFDDYVPSAATARSALEVALRAWESGQSPGKIDSGSPAVQSVDSQWQAGRKLVRYEILEQLPAEGPPRFSVRLVLENPAAEIETRYVVLGREPFWVFRDEDYARVSGWHR